MSMLHHTDADACPMCESKLQTAHKTLALWFHKIKRLYPNTHISWAWRGEKDQDAFYREGRTRARWPKSPHNHMEGGTPCSLALDIFQIDEDGVARFSPLFYAKIDALNAENKEPITWGGKFKSIGDGDHFQVNV